MKIKQKGQISCTRALNYLKLDKNLLFSSLLVVLIGGFLLPNLVLASPITVNKVINMTNKARKDAGVTTLIENNRLTNAATAKGEEIFRAQIFDHNIGKRKFSSWVREVGYKYSYTGENLAIDFISNEGLMKAWIESEAHRKNLLNPNYKEIGVAILNGNFDGQNTIIVVQIFGARLKIIIPEEISRKNEQLIPYRGEVLSANTYYTATKNIKKQSNVNSIVLMFSVLATSFATYLYFLTTTYFIKIWVTKKP